MSITHRVKPSFLTSNELKNAYQILTQLPEARFRALKQRLNLTQPDVLGPTTVSAFLRQCERSGIELSDQGIRQFKASHPPLNPELPIGPQTAAAICDALALEPEWMTFAKAELAAGVREASGGADNPRILEYHRATRLGSPEANHDETSWCSSFANWCMMQAGYPRTHSAMARSWLTWGQPLAKPRYGCVTVFWRESPNGPFGHVGFYVSETRNHILLLGGNQDDAVSEAKQPRIRLLGYRWPNPRLQS